MLLRSLYFFVRLLGVVFCVSHVLVSAHEHLSLFARVHLNGARDVLDVLHQLLSVVQVLLSLLNHVGQVISLCGNLDGTLVDLLLLQSLAGSLLGLEVYAFGSFRFQFIEIKLLSGLNGLASLLELAKPLSEVLGEHGHRIVAFFLCESRITHLPLRCT